MIAFRRRLRRDERGTFLVIFALCLTVLVLIIALVIDLGFTRSDRRNGQLGVDNAAATAAQTFAETSDAQAACADAFSIVAVSLDVPAFSGQDCTAFAAACNDATARSTVGTSGQFRLTVHHPVIGTSALLAKTSTIGNGGVTATADDGNPCQRLGVELETEGEPFFGAIAGSTQRTSRVHAVGRVSTGGTAERPLNLLALERYGCDAMVASGGGTIFVNSFVDASGVRQPGIAAVDSDASGTCPGLASTVEANGGGKLIANGVCAANPAIECVGTGSIPLMAPFVSGTCSGNGDVPGCREVGVGSAITPNVEESPGRFTRAPLDYRYNCKPSYASEPWYGGSLQQPIPGCPSPTANTDYIDELKTYVASITTMSNASRAAAGWQTIGGSMPACSVSNTTYVGNVFVNCNTFRPSGTVTFAGGNVIFRQDVDLAGELILHNPCPAPNPLCAPSLSWAPGQNLNERQSSTDAGWVSVGRELLVSGASTLRGKMATLLFPNATGRLRVTGGNTYWEAPDSAGPLDDLAVWSEGTGDHSLGGSGAIDIVGALFTGQARFDYAGNAPQLMDEAQFIANRLRFTGSSSLNLAPLSDRNVSFPLEPTFGLIR